MKKDTKNIERTITDRKTREVTVGRMEKEFEEHRKDRTGPINRGAKGRGRKMDKRDERFTDKRPGDSHRHNERRRLHSDGSQSSDAPGTPQPDRNFGLKVTFGETERKVKLHNNEETSRRQRQHSGGGTCYFSVFVLCQTFVSHIFESGK